jgi:hypothetical protein
LPGFGVFRPIEFHSQTKTVAASMIANRKVSGQRSYRVATYEEDQQTVRETVCPTIGQSFNRPDMISMRLRRLLRRLSYFTALLRDFRPGVRGDRI